MFQIEIRPLAIVLLTLQLSQGIVADEPLDPNWPQFRGYSAAGVGSGSPPTSWNVETGQNVLWARPIDGLGHSCPIVFGDRIYLTTAANLSSKDLSTPTGFLNGTGKSAEDSGQWVWQIACLDRDTGIQLWKRTMARGVPKLSRHLKSTHCDCTPVTDGKHVVAFFASEGLYCLDTEGNLLWKKDLGKLHGGPYDAPKMEWGFSSSPIIHENRLIVLCDCLNVHFIAVFDLQTGEELRRIPRNDYASWSTPTIVTTDTETQLVCNGYKEMAGYDLETGERLWTLSDGGDLPVPAPLFSHGLIVLTNAHGRSPIYAIDPAARGDLTPDDEEALPEGLLWYLQRGGSYIPTPIIVGEHLYVCNDRGILTVREVKTGKEVYNKRVGGMYSASAVASQDHIYLNSEDGTIRVVKTGTEFEMLGENQMHDRVFATPAITGDRLLVRTSGTLYCIAKTDSSEGETQEPADQQQASE